MSEPLTPETLAEWEAQNETRVRTGEGGPFHYAGLSYEQTKSLLAAARREMELEEENRVMRETLVPILRMVATGQHRLSVISRRNQCVNVSTVISAEKADKLLAILDGVFLPASSEAQ